MTTLKATKTELAANGISLTKQDGEYRVAFKGTKRNDTYSEAYFTSDLHDALMTGLSMARKAGTLVTRVERPAHEVITDAADGKALSAVDVLPDSTPIQTLGQLNAMLKSLPMSASLPELIARFVREEIPMFANARDAYAMCDTTSYRFIHYCERAGIFGLKTYTFEASAFTKNYCDSRDQVNPAPDIYIVRDENGRLLTNEGGYRMCSWHCVVDAGECLIDFTARQYQTETHRMEFPTIIPMNRAMAAHA